jgi:hypothetical protein
MAALNGFATANLPPRFNGLAAGESSAAIQ